MIDSAYTPPKANVQTALENEPDFYTVAPRKYFALYLLTWGWYEFYWLYRNWSLYKRSSRRPVLPVIRAIFSFFFTPVLFWHVDRHLQQQGKTRMRSWWLIGMIHIIGSGARILIALGSQAASNAAETAAWLPVILLFVLIQMINLFVVQKAINRATHDPAGSRNSTFGFLNYVCMGIGLCYWLVLLSIFLSSL